MKISSNYFIYLTLSVLTLVSCGKKLAPSEVKLKVPETYDVAAFNFVYVEALKQKLMGNGGDALKYLEQSLKINPQSDAAYFQMGQIVVANGDLKNGKKYIIKALSLDEANIWYLTMLGSLYYQEKNIDSAVFCYEKAVKYFPDRDNLKLMLGNLYSEDKRYDKANSVFESIDERYGINETSTVSLIRNLIAEGKYDAALLKTQTILKDFPDGILYNGLLAEIYKGKGENEKALNVYGKMLEKSPDDPRIQLSICDFLISEKNYDELFSLLNNVILNANVERQDKVSLMVKILGLPDLTKEWEDKLTVSLMVLEANYKEDNIVPLLRPELLIKQNKLSEAGLLLGDIVKSNPDNYYAWEKELFVYLQLKDYKNLYKIGEECATRFNTSFNAKLLYANGALEIGKYDIALDELKKAEILAGNSKDSLVQVFTMRADVYYRMKDFNKSFETFETALKTNTNDLTLMNNYAYYLAEQDTKLKEAEELAKKVTEKDKDNITFLDTYGWVLYKRGKLQEAAKVMESIINRTDKPDAVYYEHFGYILKKLRKCPEAVENWNTALKLDSTKTELIKEIENCGK